MKSEQDKAYTCGKMVFIWKLAPEKFFEMIFWGLVNCVLTVASIWSTRQILSLVHDGYSVRLLRTVVLYGILLILSAGYSAWYKRYYVQFRVVLDFEKKVREKLHKKSVKISNEMFEFHQINAMIRLADGARQNLFRYMEIWISIAMSLLQAVVVVGAFAHSASAEYVPQDG